MWDYIYGLIIFLIKTQLPKRPIIFQFYLHPSISFELVLHQLGIRAKPDPVHSIYSVSNHLITTKSYKPTNYNNPQSVKPPSPNHCDSANRHHHSDLKANQIHISTTTQNINKNYCHQQLMTESKTHPDKTHQAISPSAPLNYHDPMGTNTRVTAQNPENHH